jgi:lactoylglutathione lyase
VITHIKTTAVYVENQEKAIEFYTETLGFEIRARAPMGPQAEWIELAPQGAQSAIVVYPRSLMEDWQRRKASIVFSCENAEVTYQELARRGVVFKQPPKEMAWGVFAIFSDPDGNEFALISPII